jgi:hypothetical protein
MTKRRLKPHRGFYSQFSVERIQLLVLQRSKTILPEATKFITRIRLPATKLYRRPRVLAKHIIDNLNDNEHPDTSSGMYLYHLSDSEVQRQSERNDSNRLQSARSSAATFYTARSSQSSIMSFATARGSTVSMTERFTRMYA